MNFDEERDIKRIIKEELSYREASSKRVTFFIALIVAVLASVLTLFLVCGRERNIKKNNSEKSSVYEINPNEEINVEKAVALKAKNSIVGISSIGTKTTNELFGNKVPSEELGSGVIVSKNGYILTNSHVIMNGKASKLQVLLENQETYEAKLLWHDVVLDLAIIKIEKDDLTPIEIGNSDKIAVGDKAIAIGNPFGTSLQSTLTSGYISGLERSIRVENGQTLEGMIQTDAAINAGNSGGALLNSKGELIGINTAKNAAGEGIGFAIPINTAKNILQNIIEKGEFKPLYIGISGMDVKRYKRLTGENIKTDSGIVVLEVLSNSPAEIAGIKVNDVILELDSGKKVDSMNAMRKILINHKEGEELKAKILRGDSTMEVILKLK